MNSGAFCRGFCDSGGDDGTKKESGRLYPIKIGESEENAEAGVGTAFLVIRDASGADPDFLSHVLRREPGVFAEGFQILGEEASLEVVLLR
jgi:hypothetical protein